MRMESLELEPLERQAVWEQLNYSEKNWENLLPALLNFYGEGTILRERNTGSPKGVAPLTDLAESEASYWAVIIHSEPRLALTLLCPKNTISEQCYPELCNLLAARIADQISDALGEIVMISTPSRMKRESVLALEAQSRRLLSCQYVHRLNDQTIPIRTQLLVIPPRDSGNA